MTTSPTLWRSCFFSAAAAAALLGLPVRRKTACMNAAKSSFGKT